MLITAHLLNATFSSNGAGTEAKRPHQEDSGEGWPRSPNGKRAVAKLGAFVRVGTALDPVVQEVAVLVASSERGFEFEINLHEGKLRALGVDPASVYRARDGRITGLSAVVGAVAVFACAIARGEHVSDADFEELLAMLGSSTSSKFWPSPVTT